MGIFARHIHTIRGVRKGIGGIIQHKLIAVRELGGKIIHRIVVDVGIQILRNVKELNLGNLVLGILQPVIAVAVLGDHAAVIVGGTQSGEFVSVTVHQIEVVAVIGAVFLVLPVEDAVVAEDIIGNPVAVENIAAVAGNGGGEGILHRHLACRTLRLTIIIAVIFCGDSPEAIQGGHLLPVCHRVSRLGLPVIGAYLTDKFIGTAGQEVAALDASAGQGEAVNIPLLNIGSAHSADGVASADGAGVAAREAAHAHTAAGIAGHIQAADGAGAGDGAIAAIQAYESTYISVGTVGTDGDKGILRGAARNGAAVEANQAAHIQSRVIGIQVDAVARHGAVTNVTIVRSGQGTGVGIVVGLLGRLGKADGPVITHLGNQEDIAELAVQSGGIQILSDIPEHAGVQRIGPEADPGDGIALAVVGGVEGGIRASDRRLDGYSPAEASLSPMIAAVVQIHLLLQGDSIAHGSGVAAEVLTQQIQMPGGTDADHILGGGGQGGLSRAGGLHLLHGGGEVRIEVVVRNALVLVIHGIGSIHLDKGIEVPHRRGRRIDNFCRKIPEIVVIILSGAIHAALGNGVFFVRIPVDRIDIVRLTIVVCNRNFIEPVTVLFHILPIVQQSIAIPHNRLCRVEEVAARAVVTPPAVGVLFKIHQRAGDKQVAVPVAVVMQHRSSVLPVDKGIRIVGQAKTDAQIVRSGITGSAAEPEAAGSVKIGFGRSLAVSEIGIPFALTDGSEFSLGIYRLVITGVVDVCQIAAGSDGGIEHGRHRRGPGVVGTDVHDGIAVADGGHGAGHKSGRVRRHANGEARAVAAGDGGGAAAGTCQAAHAAAHCGQVAVGVGAAEFHRSAHAAEQAARVGAAPQNFRGVAFRGGDIAFHHAYQAAHGIAPQGYACGAVVLVIVVVTGQVRAGVYHRQPALGFTRQGAHRAGAGDLGAHEAHIRDGYASGGLAQGAEHTGRGTVRVQIHGHAADNIVYGIVLLVLAAAQHGHNAVVIDGLEGSAGVGFRPPEGGIVHHIVGGVLEVDVANLNHIGDFDTLDTGGREVIEVLQVTARADIGGAGFRIHGVEEAVEHGGGSCGIQSRIGRKGAGALLAQLREDLHGHVLTGVHSLEQLLLAELLGLAGFHIKAVHRDGVCTVKVAVVHRVQDNFLLGDRSGPLAGEGHGKPQKAVLELGRDLHGNIRLQFLGVNNVHGDIQGGVGHDHLAAQNACAAVVAHAASLPVCENPVLVGGAACVPGVNLGGGEALLAVVHAVDVAVLGIVLDDPVVCLHLGTQRACRQQHGSRGGLRIIHGVQPGVCIGVIPILGLDG